MSQVTLMLLASQDDMDLKALGFDIAEGVNDPYLPGDCGIFVTRVDKGSIADGRLRYELPQEKICLCGFINALLNTSPFVLSCFLE